MYNLFLVLLVVFVTVMSQRGSCKKMRKLNVANKEHMQAIHENSVLLWITKSTVSMIVQNNNYYIMIYIWNFQKIVLLFSFIECLTEILWNLYKKTFVDCNSFAMFFSYCTPMEHSPEYYFRISRNTSFQILSIVSNTSDLHWTSAGFLSMLF